ncbi:XshC-Cox1 family protein [Wenjunlia vitaminophila]|uniref:XshC-Cox1 family protein n=1 Tax=Wenjunlia vitaminophila TaxID=76728 RepID=A0A0T6LQ92_WENVI|nr:XdhC/CoxI family protein [Wenjunlia vitaminophila]KRV48015.1 XshC-Cox1 family protein [Wenjunlia vitaminophila]
MRDVLDQALAWHREGIRFALATVVRTWRSSPREPGATMAVAETGEVAGSLSGGCVEGAVVELAQQVLATSSPALERYGVSDDDALAIGLTCGGVLEVLVRPVEVGAFAELEELAGDVRAGRPVAVATTVTAGPLPPGARLVVGPGGHTGTLGDPGLDTRTADAARDMLRRGATGMLGLVDSGCAEDPEVFVESYAPPPRMLVFGAIDFAAAVTRIGRFLGYRVTLCDARAVFATRQRFPEADEVVVDWPHRYLAAVRDQIDERTVICVLTHDPKFDVPVLEVALRTPAGYVGAMGSRRTHQDRLRRLREAGLEPHELARLSSPIGLDLGARGPEETAVSIAAEIVAVQGGGTGRRLSETRSPIHRRRPDATPVGTRPAAGTEGGA